MRWALHRWAQPSASLSGLFPKKFWRLPTTRIHDRQKHFSSYQTCLESCGPALRQFNNNRFFARTIRVDRLQGTQYSTLTECISSQLQWNRVQGLRTFEELQYQAAVTSRAQLGLRLVDTSEYCQNFGLWNYLLDTRLRLDGLNGAWDIWQGLRSREIDLPTLGVEAEQLWSTFVAAGIQHDRKDEIFDYAVELHGRTRRKYDGLYDLYMRYFFTSDLLGVGPWHRKFGEIGLPPAGALAGLVRLVVKSTKVREALFQFKRVYKKSPDQKIYDIMIPNLCDAAFFDRALVWHDLCVLQNDRPSSAAVTDSLREHFALSGELGTVKRITQSLVDSGVSFAPSISGTWRDNTKISRTIFNELLGEVHDIKPKVISDEFCARSFATKTLPVDFIIKGLTAFGVDNIGPMALRQLALRNPSVEMIEQHLATLGRCGARIQAHAFSKVLLRAVEEKNLAHLSLILQSDMHPDAYEDYKLQKNLVSLSLQTNNWQQLHLNLVILTSTDENRRSTAWNILLLAYMVDRNWGPIQVVFKDMLANGVLLSERCVRQSFFLLLRPRQPGKRLPTSPEGQFVDDLGFLTSMWLQHIRAGGEIPAAAWGQVHTCYGMENRLADVESLSLWLAAHYSSKSGPSLSELQASPKNEALTAPGRTRRRKLWMQQLVAKQHPLQQLFQTQRLAALVHWSFKAIGRPLPRAQQRRLNADQWMWTSDDLNKVLTNTTHGWLTRKQNSPIWFRGIALLRRLQRYGVHISTETVRRICRQRLITLWGIGKQSNDKENRIARAIVAHDIPLLLNMARVLNKVWNRQLFPGLRRLDNVSKKRLTRWHVMRAIFYDDLKSRTRRGYGRAAKGYSQRKMGVFSRLRRKVLQATPDQGTRIVSQ